MEENVRGEDNVGRDDNFGEENNVGGVVDVLMAILLVEKKVDNEIVGWRCDQRQDNWL